MKLPKRKSLRLENYDYSSENFYFITLCTYNKNCMFGLPGDDNLLRRIVEEELVGLSARYDGVEIDRYVIMPNHIHAVLIIKESDPMDPKPRPTLMQIVGLFKAGVTKRIRQIVPGLQIWQQSFYDHVIRKKDSYVRISRYIDENPLRWEHDEYYR